MKTKKYGMNNHPQDSRVTEAENGIFMSVAAQFGTGGGNTHFVVEEETEGLEMKYIVRRLSPTECERLQAFPDGWTDIGEWLDESGKKPKIRKTTDSNRYKALGNSIALPQWWWIVQKMKPYLPENATLGSLFSGIGGFELVWEETHGKGTARWASEIEPFCIAVTKRHLGEDKDE